MFYIDSESDQPIYSQIRDGIVREIARGGLREGDPLPSVRTLGQDLGVNPMTVNKAYGILKEEGFIVIDRRLGAKVSVDNRPQALEDLRVRMEKLLIEARARGLSPDLIEKWMRGEEE